MEPNLDYTGVPPTLSSLTIAKIVEQQQHHGHGGVDLHEEIPPPLELEDHEQHEHDHGEHGEHGQQEHGQHEHEHEHEHDQEQEQEEGLDEDELDEDQGDDQDDSQMPLGQMGYYMDGSKASQDSRSNYKKEMRKRKRQPEEWLKNVKKRQRATTHTTGEDCHCKRFKCFEEKTSEEDRQVIISVFNNLADYNKQQAYLASLIEVGEVNSSQIGDKNPDSPGEKRDELDAESLQAQETGDGPMPSIPGISGGQVSDGSLSSGKKKKAHTYSTKYHVKISNARIRVCQKGFCSIFGITNKRVNLLASKLHKNGLGLPPTDMRGKHANRGTRYPTILSSSYAESGFGPKGE